MLTVFYSVADDAGGNSAWAGEKDNLSIPIFQPGGQSFIGCKLDGEIHCWGTQIPSWTDHSM